MRDGQGCSGTWRLDRLRDYRCSKGIGTIPNMRMPWSKSGNLQLDLLDAPAMSDAATAPPAAPGAAARLPSMVPTASLYDDANNPRTEIPDAELDELADDSFGQRRVIIPFQLFYLSERHAIFSDMKVASSSPRASTTRDARPRRTVDSSIDAAISRKVRRAKPGTVFTPALFAGLGGRAAVDKALQRLVARDELRRLPRGLYDRPRHDPLLGTLWPSVDAVIAALAGKDKLRLQPTGAYAANLLGLSDQVPARVEFLTDGTSRTVKAGPMQIVLKRTTPRQMAAAGRISGLVIQALRNLGPDHLTARHLNKLGRALPEFERRTLLEHLTLAPGWMQPALRALANGSSPLGQALIKSRTP